MSPEESKAQVVDATTVDGKTVQITLHQWVTIIIDESIRRHQSECYIGDKLQKHLDAAKTIKEQIVHNIVGGLVKLGMFAFAFGIVYLIKEVLDKL